VHGGTNKTLLDSRVVHVRHHASRQSWLLSKEKGHYGLKLPTADTTPKSELHKDKHSTTVTQPRRHSLACHQAFLSSIVHMSYVVVVYALTCCLRTLHMRLCTRYLLPPLTTPILLLLLPALQGAFNIAYVGVAWFTKQPRPYPPLHSRRSACLGEAGRRGAQQAVCPSHLLYIALGSNPTSR